MSSINSLGSFGPRLSTLSMSDSFLNSLQQTQQALQVAQNQVSTGKAVNVPSDDPSKVAAILAVTEQLATRSQTDNNISYATSILNTTDQALSDANTILTSANSLALSEAGTGTGASSRSSEATVVDANIQGLLDVANRQYQGVSLFGGTASPTNSQPVFSEFLGGILYSGNTTNMTSDLGLSAPVQVNSNGAEAFNALSAQVSGQSNLDPQATAATQLSNVTGAQGAGVRPGSIVVDVDGTSVTIDLTHAQTLGEVANQINHAIAGVDGTAGSVAISGAGFALTAAAGHTIQVADLAGGKTAADLGLGVTATGTTVAGSGVAPKLTDQTTLASLGGAIDWASGLKITQGSTTAIADFSSAKTIGDLKNVISGLNLGLQMNINSTGTGLNLVSAVSGINLTVGENNGGATATDLGLRTFNDATTLASLNNGEGISRVQGSDDFEVDLHDGATFRVNLDGATSISDVLSKISGAATAAGVSVGAPGATGTQFNVGLATDGNGIALEDKTAGSGDFKVLELGQSLAAQGLGIYQNADSASTINGTDVAPVQVDSVFTHLIQLRNSLANNDSTGITVAGEALQTDTNNVTQARAGIGTRAQRVTQAQTSSASAKLSEQTLLSNLQDADITAAITQFTQLQNQLQGTLQVGAKVLTVSLLDFLQ